jgi:hypothetical protein
MAEAYFLGLDLGQARDFSALCALRRLDRPRGGSLHTLRGLKRWPLGTLYTAICAEVVGLVGRPPLAGCQLGIDHTGVGGAFVDMIKAAGPHATVRPVQITAGSAVTADGMGFHVAKVELVGTLHRVLQEQRLEIPESIPDRATLQQELLAFRARVSAQGHESFEADWRTRAHDDLVLSVAIAVWLAEHLRPAGQAAAGSVRSPCARAAAAYGDPNRPPGVIDYQAARPPRRVERGRFFIP